MIDKQIANLSGHADSQHDGREEHKPPEVTVHASADPVGVAGQTDGGHAQAEYNEGQGGVVELRVDGTDVVLDEAGAILGRHAPDGGQEYAHHCSQTNPEQD